MSTNETDYSTAPYLVIAPNYFGRGFTVDEAKKNLRGQGGTLAVHVVYRLPEGALNAHTDDWGNLRWTWADGADTTGKAEIVSKRGASA
jgi:hypothetical protein